MSLFLFCFSPEAALQPYLGMYHKKGSRQSNTARLAETAICSSCTTVASTLVILFLGGKCKLLQKRH
jgi:hypothetical protein